MINLIEVEEIFSIFGTKFFAFNSLFHGIRSDGVQTFGLDAFRTLLKFYRISTRVDGYRVDSVGELILLSWRVSELSHAKFYGGAEVSWDLNDVLSLLIVTYLEDKLPHVILQ